MAPSVYYLSRSLQKFLDGKSFTSNEEVKNHPDQFFASKDQKFFERGIMLPPGRWQKVLDHSGQYIICIKYLFILRKFSFISQKQKRNYFPNILIKLFVMLKINIKTLCSIESIFYYFTLVLINLKTMGTDTYKYRY